MRGRAPPFSMSDMTTATIPLPTVVSTGRTSVCTQLGLPPAPSATVATTALYTLLAVNISQFSTMMTADRRDVAMPLYTVSCVTPTVTTVAHATNSLLDDVHTRQASSGAFITHTSRGPAVAFPTSAYPEWGNAPVGYPTPVLYCRHQLWLDQRCTRPPLQPSCLVLYLLLVHCRY